MHGWQSRLFEQPIKSSKHSNFPQSIPIFCAEDKILSMAGNDQVLVKVAATSIDHLDSILDQLAVYGQPSTSEGYFSRNVIEHTSKIRMSISIAMCIRCLEAPRPPIFARPSTPSKDGGFLWYPETVMFWNKWCFQVVARKNG
ncbi:MAG TPA: hypothetical protein VGN34_03745 [Ktedonobacteraceae bacterium]